MTTNEYIEAMAALLSNGDMAAIARLKTIALENNEEVRFDSAVDILLDNISDADKRKENESYLIQSITVDALEEFKYVLGIDKVKQEV